MKFFAMLWGKIFSKITWELCVRDVRLQWGAPLRWEEKFTEDMLNTV